MMTKNLTILMASILIGALAQAQNEPSGVPSVAASHAANVLAARKAAGVLVAGACQSEVAAGSCSTELYNKSVRVCIEKHTSPISSSCKVGLRKARHLVKKARRSNP